MMPSCLWLNDGLPLESLQDRTEHEGKVFALKMGRAVEEESSPLILN